MNSDLKVVGSKEQKNSKPEGQANPTPEKKEPVEIAHQPGTQEHYLGGDYSSDTIKKMRKDPLAIGKLFKEGKYPYTDRIPRSKYEQEKGKLQIELLRVQNWVKVSGQKILVIFEGRDAAGKGGDTSMAATCCGRALDIYQETKDHLGEADAYRLLGRVFTLRKQWTSDESRSSGTESKSP